MWNALLFESFTTNLIIRPVQLFLCDSSSKNTVRQPLCKDGREVQS